MYPWNAEIFIAAAAHLQVEVSLGLLSTLGDVSRTDRWSRIFVGLVKGPSRKRIGGRRERAGRSSSRASSVGDTGGNEG